MKCSHPMSVRSGDKMCAVPCGQCMPCRVNRSQEWAFRIEQEMEVAVTAHFLTLTYRDENLIRNDSGNPVLHKPDLQKFFKRIRYYAESQNQILVEKLDYQQTLTIPPIRYYAVGEYGEATFRPRYHAIAFNIPKDVLTGLERIWGHGHARIGSVSKGSITYVTKYITKVDSRDLEKLDLVKPFAIMSKGIGANYVTDTTREYHSRPNSLYTINRKYKQKIGKYLENKIHDTPEKQAKVKRTKEQNAAKFQREEDKFYADLRKEGVDIYQHDKQKISDKENLYNLNNKRNKL